MAGPDFQATATTTTNNENSRYRQHLAGYFWINRKKLQPVKAKMLRK